MRKLAVLMLVLSLLGCRVIGKDEPPPVPTALPTEVGTLAEARAQRLGRGVNLGAGTRLSNVAVSSVRDKKTGKRPSIKINIEGKEYDTGLSKFGAVVGDGCQIGCNVVTNPGTLIGKNTLVYPNLSLKKGYYPPNKIIKLLQEVVAVDRK